MSFPTSPINGQTAIVNNVNYVYNSTVRSWTRVPSTNISAGNLTVSGNTFTGKLYTTNGLFWTGNSVSVLADNPFTSDTNLGTTTDSVSSSFDFGATTDPTLTETYDFGGLVSYNAIYGHNIVANSMAGSKLITGTDISVGNVTAATISLSGDIVGNNIVCSDITGANIVANNVTVAQTITSGNIVPQINATYDLGSPASRWKNIYLSGSSIYLDSTIITANTAANTAQINGIDIATVDNYDLDDISTYTDGLTQIFPLTYNLANVSLRSPWQLTVAVNGVQQPAFDSSPNASVVWQSFVFPANKGYTLHSNSQIKFARAPAARSDIYIRKQPGSTPPTVKIYPFKPIDILIG